MWLHDHPGLQEASWLRCDMHRAEKSSQGCIIGGEPVLGFYLGAICWRPV